MERAVVARMFRRCHRRAITRFHGVLIVRRPSAAAATSRTAAAAESAISKVAPRARPLISHEMIEVAAYYISISGSGGSQDDNWFRAERELNARWLA